LVVGSPWLALLVFSNQQHTEVEIILNYM